MTKYYRAMLFLLAITLAAGCATTREPVAENQTDELPPLPAPPEQRPLIAIAGFQNKSAYAADKLWETSAEMLMSRLIRAGYFRVVEWERMKQLFDREALSTCSLVYDRSQMTEAQKILLCEYFLSGAVTRFDVSQTGKVSAMKKVKHFTTTVRIDLLLQNARTGEYIGTGIGRATEEQEFRGGMSGGTTGTWDPASANEALEKAIAAGVNELIINYDLNRRAAQ